MPGPLRFTRGNLHQKQSLRENDHIIKHQQNKCLSSSYRYDCSVAGASGQSSDNMPALVVNAASLGSMFVVTNPA